MDIDEVLTDAGEGLRAAWADTPPPPFLPRQPKRTGAVVAAVVVMASFAPLIVFTRSQDPAASGVASSLEDPIVEASTPTTPTPDSASNRQQLAIESCMAGRGLSYIPSFVAEGGGAGAGVELFSPVGGRIEERLAGARANGFGMYDWYTGYEVPAEPTPAPAMPTTV